MQALGDGVPVDIDETKLLALVKAMQKGRPTLSVKMFDEYPRALRKHVQPFEYAMNNRFMSNVVMSAAVISWHTEIGGTQITLEKWDSRNVVHTDFFKLFSTDWALTLMKFDLRGSLSCIRHLEIDNFEAFKHDWALFIMFGGVDEQD